MSTEASLGTPEWEQLDIPEVDDAEPEDAGIRHLWDGEEDGS